MINIWKVTSFMVLAIVAFSVKIPCHRQQPPFHQTKNFKISDRQTFIATMYDGVQIIIDAVDAVVSERIQRQGSFEPDNVRTFARFIKQGSVIVNIGAHVGMEAILYTKLAGPNSKLFLFEPYEVTYRILKKNIYLNQLQNRTTIYNMAVSNKENKQTVGYIMVDFYNTGSAQLYTDQTIHNAPPELKDDQSMVRIKPVDDVLPKDIPIDFILIDVERSELNCLEGMLETVERSPNLVIQAEWSGRTISQNADQYDERVLKLLKWFAAKNFRFYRMDRVGMKEDPKDCKDQKFIEMSIQQLRRINKELVKTNLLIDIIIAAGSIDPNSLQ